MNDILGTGLIILIIGLAVAPFFLLSSAFGAPKRVKKGEDQNDGPVIPVPTNADGPFPSPRKPHTDPDDDGDADDGDVDDDGNTHPT
jgi:hypothetical protein